MVVVVLVVVLVVVVAVVVTNAVQPCDVGEDCAPRDGHSQGDRDFS